MTWKFDKTVASNFVSHARGHIPNYDLVIDKSIDVCNTKSKDSKIVDVGCASGETLQRLYANGFTNLHGIDSSQDMLAVCPPNIATYYYSDSLVAGPYDIIIMNWVLHFIKEKEPYLVNIYKNLNPGGIFILSDKVSTENFATKFYYDYKRSKGVSDSEILAKEKSLAGVMNINSLSWYLDKLKAIGFNSVYLMDASWCFASVVCLKE